MRCHKIRLIVLVSNFLILSHTGISEGAKLFSRQMYEPQEWQIAITPYLWTSHFSGAVTVNGQSADFDMSISDLFKLRNFSAMIHLEGSKGKLRLLTDVVFTRLGKDIDMKDPDPNIYANLESDQVMWEFGAGYLLTALQHKSRPRPMFATEIIGGGRYNHTDLSLNFQVKANATDYDSLLAGYREKSKSWVDPFIGGRMVLHITDRWVIGARADVGGFSIGSNVTWNIIARVHYIITQSIAIDLGGRVTHIDYEDGDGENRFAYDTTTAGPAVALTIRLK